MFATFNESAQSVMIRAKVEMQELKHPYIGSEHLLLAILHDDTLEITHRLAELNVTYDRFYSEVVKIIGIGTCSNTWFLYTPLLKKIIESAVSNSNDDNRSVTVESLFMSLLQEGEGVANRLLIGMNIDIDALYDHFLTILSNKTISKKNHLICEFSQNLNDKCMIDGFDPVIGRDCLISRIIEILMRRTKNNPILVGDAGVGKTALVEELVRKIVNHEVPSRLENCQVYSIAMSSLVSNTKYRGEFEERINSILKDIENDDNIILFIDEIHTLVGAGGAEGAIDAANILKPYLARGKIKIIGATTCDEYSLYIECDKALVRRFQKVMVEEPDFYTTEKILLGLKPIYESYHGVKISNEIINEIVLLSEKYLKSGRQPDKAIDLLDEVCSKVEMIDTDSEKRLRALKSRIAEINNEKNKAVLNHKFDYALELKKELEKCENDINTFNLNFKFISKEVVKDDLYSVIYSRTGIPIMKIRNYSASNLKNQLSKAVFGHNGEISEFVDYLYNTNYSSTSGIKSLLLVGKNGVGKTFLAQNVAELLYSKNSFFKIDMSEYSEDISVNKIIGAPPGYAGYNKNNYLLSNIKNYPYSLVLLENFDCCHRNVLNLFLNGISDGYMSCSNGEKVYLTNVLFVLTTSNYNFSNLGFLSEKAIGSDVEKYYSELFHNCYLKVIYMSNLSDANIKKIITQRLKQVVKKNDLEFSISSDFVNKILAESDYLNVGAHKINKLIDKYLNEYLEVKS